MRTAAVVAPLYFFVNSALVAGAIALSTRQSIVAHLAAQLPVERAELPGGRGAGGRRHRGLDARLVRLARPAGRAALPGVPQLPHRRRAAARGAGRDAPRDGSPARDDRGARAGDRSAGRLHSRAHPVDSALRRHARRGRRAHRRRGAGRADRGAAARHRQHGGARAHPVEARFADARGIRARQDPSARRRGDPRRTCRSARRSASWCWRTTSAGTASAIRRVCAATTSRSARASWRSPTATARCRRRGRTGPPAARPRRSRCCASTRARRSIPRSSSCSSPG